MSRENDDIMPRPGEQVMKCPECGAKALMHPEDMSAPGHLHDMDTDEPYFVQYEPIEDRPKRGRPRATPVEA